MGTFPPEKMAETPSAQGFGYFSRSKFGLEAGAQVSPIPGIVTLVTTLSNYRLA